MYRYLWSCGGSVLIVTIASPPGLWLRLALCPSRPRRHHSPNLFPQGLGSLRCGTARLGLVGLVGVPRIHHVLLVLLGCLLLLLFLLPLLLGLLLLLVLGLLGFVFFVVAQLGSPGVLCSPVPLVRQYCFVDLFSAGKQGTNLPRESADVDSELFFHRRVALANQLDKLVCLLPRLLSLLMSLEIAAKVFTLLW